MNRGSFFSKALSGLAAGALVLLASCGGGGGGGRSTALQSAANAGIDNVASAPIPGANVLQITVDRGTDGNAINTPFVTVRVCQPGTATCVDIDHVVLDTGSSGLRVAASALPPGMTLASVTTAGGQAVGQCAQFASGFSWGSVRRADVRMGGEVATNLPIQVVNDTALPFAQDAVRAACDVGPPGAPNFYYGCNAGGGCSPSRLALASQVSNPVMAFANNNNGVALVLPAVPSGGAGQASGSLLLGVGTQSNNQLGTATVFAANAQGFITTTYNGVEFRSSFLDSGYNGMFFNDAALPSCGDFYCPNTSPLPLSAVNTSAAGVTAQVDFFIDDVRLIRDRAAAAHIGGSTSIPDSFDYGLPFFFGRSVFVGFAAPFGSGPFWAY